MLAAKFHGCLSVKAQIVKSMDISDGRTSTGTIVRMITDIKKKCSQLLEM